MAWNEPGKDDNDRKDPNDPWGSGGNDGPPDLDEVVRNMQAKLASIFGGKKSGDSTGKGKGGPGSTGILGLIGLLALAYAAFNSFYVIDAPERGVVLRFGEYVTTLEPGFRIRWPRPIEEVIKVNVNKIKPLTHKASMLTKDENIVEIDLAVQYKIKSATDFLFNVNSPDLSLLQATESAIRYVIGHSEMDFVLTEGRDQIADDTMKLIQQTVDQYKAGLLVTSVNMRAAKPPEQVKSAFDDFNKASEDKQRLINEAQAYENEIIPKSRGKAARLREDASAYKARVVAQAEGQASRFEQLLTEYKKAPLVTRERLYVESVESVLSRNKKIFLDTGSGNNILYLPLGQGESGQIPKPVLQQPSNTTARNPQSSSENVDRAIQSGDDMRTRSTH